MAVEKNNAQVLSFNTLEDLYAHRELSITRDYRKVFGSDPSPERLEHYIGNGRKNTAAVVNDDQNIQIIGDENHRLSSRDVIDSDSMTSLKLDDDGSVCEHDWFIFLEEIIKHKLINPLRLAGTPPPNAQLWICIDANDGAQLNKWQQTFDSIATLLKASEYPVHVILLKDQIQSFDLPETHICTSTATIHKIHSLLEIANLVGQNDLVLFIKPGDEIRSEIHMALKYFGAFDKDITLIDMCFREKGRIYPLLMHGVDPTHVKYCDYFYSRFCMTGKIIHNLFSQTQYSTLRDLVLGYFHEFDKFLIASNHISIPLLFISLDKINISNSKEELLKNGDVSKLVPQSHVVESETFYPKISVIICTKDGAHLLRQLVWRLLKESLVLDVVIVSNNSTNIFSKLLLDELSVTERVKVLRYDKSFNFSAQCNLGAQYANGEFFLFLNDDICPVSNDWLERMYKTIIEHAPDRVIVGPFLLYPDQTVQHAGMFLGFQNVAGHAFRHATLPDSGTSMMLFAPRNVSCLTGAALIMARELFNDLNGFDSMLATYLQDVDISLRALNSGFSLIFEPRALLFHMESVSVKPGLVNDHIKRIRGNEYNYFSRRWGDAVKSHDEWMNPLLDPSDESLLTLRL